MHIAFLLTQDLECPSGLGRYWPLGKNLARLGHKVTILALHSDYHSLDGSRKKYYRSGVRIHYVGQMHVHKAGNYKYYFSIKKLIWVSIKATFNLLKAAFEAQPDLYHIGKPHPMNSLAGIIAHFLRGKPIYLDCDDYEAFSNNFPNAFLKKIIALFENKVPLLMNGVTTNTRFMYDYFTSLGYPQQKLFYIPNGVDTDRFDDTIRNPDEIQELKKHLKVINKKVIIYIGSMSLSNHAIDLLLEAFALVHESEPKSILVLVGGGEDLKQLSKYATELGIKPYVRFVGQVPSSSVESYYHLAHVSVDPVNNDLVAQARSPLKLFESLATHTPYVSSDIGDRGSILGIPRAGILATPGDRASLAEGILFLLEDKEHREILRHRGKQRIEKYHWSYLSYKFEQVYYA